MPASILCFGHDPILVETRRQILQLAGFAGHSAHNLQELKRCFSEHPIRVLVICHTVPSKEREIARRIALDQRQPARVLLLSTKLRAFEADGAAEVLDSSDGPEGLLDRVCALLEHGHGVHNSRDKKFGLAKIQTESSGENGARTGDWPSEGNR